MSTFFIERMDEVSEISQLLKDQSQTFDKIVEILHSVRKSGGRLFFCGVGGGAGNGTHAAGDLFKSCQIKAICLTDNTPTITAITNDEGWPEVFIDQLKTWELKENDALFVFSVGGGDAEKNISANIVRAVNYAKECESSVIGVVGRPTGHTAKNGDAVIVVPNVNADFLTTHTESVQSLISHLLTEALRQRSAKWESVEKV